MALRLNALGVNSELMTSFRTTRACCLIILVICFPDLFGHRSPMIFAISRRPLETVHATLPFVSCHVANQCLILEWTTMFRI